MITPFYGSEFEYCLVYLAAAKTEVDEKFAPNFRQFRRQHHGKTVPANATVGPMDAAGEGRDVLVGVVEELAPPAYVTRAYSVSHW